MFQFGLDVTLSYSLFAILHVKAFSYKPYIVLSSGTKRLPALLHAFNLVETYRELRDGAIYMWCRIRGNETDVMARRQAVLEGIFGKSRIKMQGGRSSHPVLDKGSRGQTGANDMTVEVIIEETVHVEEDRRCLRLGNDGIYGLEYHPGDLRENSLGFEGQAEKGLPKRGYERRRECQQLVSLNGKLMNKHRAIH
jgi:hypothetical protein